MEEEYDSRELDRGFSFKTKTYGPEHPPQMAQLPVCRRSDRCEGCPYPGHGFVCWSENGDCMRSRIAKINRIEKEEQDLASNDV